MQGMAQRDGLIRQKIVSAEWKGNEKPSNFIGRNRIVNGKVEVKKNNEDAVAVDIERSSILRRPRNAQLPPPHYPGGPPVPPGFPVYPGGPPPPPGHPHYPQIPPPQQFYPPPHYPNEMYPWNYDYNNYWYYTTEYSSTTDIEGNLTKSEELKFVNDLAKRVLGGDIRERPVTRKAPRHYFASYYDSEFYEQFNKYEKRLRTRRKNTVLPETYPPGIRKLKKFFYHDDLDSLDYLPSFLDHGSDSRVSDLSLPLTVRVGNTTSPDYLFIFTRLPRTTLKTTKKSFLAQSMFNYSLEDLLAVTARHYEKDQNGNDINFMKNNLSQKFNFSNKVSNILSNDENYKNNHHIIKKISDLFSINNSNNNE
ncbi:uncharacterized protein LOC142330707 [Lycorma delicatula]|uniref:uncharacterized protein LOC142330707 n=1 Tax=Lycorma delicatula TaxID=130591 RepID=UPI003F51908A